MIDPNRYSHAIYHKLPHRRIGNFSIEKSVLPKGKSTRTYHPSGFFYNDELSDDYPVVMLQEGDDILMSDTPMEQEAYSLPVAFAYGDVLMVGLGLGLLPQLLKEHNMQVDHITIVELREEVKGLVWDRVKVPKADMVIADGKEFLKNAGKRFDYVFIDVWGTINGTLEDVRNWRELAQGCLRKGGIVDFWLRELYNRIEYRLDQGPSLATSPPGLNDPCLICGKKWRNDYAGLCADCADPLGLSEFFVKREENTK